MKNEIFGEWVFHHLSKDSSITTLISIVDQNFKNRLNVESWWFYIKLCSESISDLKSRSLIKLSKIGWMLNHDVFALGWARNPFLMSQVKLSKIGRILNHDDFPLDCAQNPFLTFNLDHRSNFQKSADIRIMMILH